MTTTLLFLGICIGLAIALAALVIWFANTMYRFGYKRGWRERGEEEKQYARED